MPAGRPSLYTEDLANEICIAISLSTQGLEHICEAHDGFPNPDTIYTWRIKHNEFAEKYARARESQMELMAQEILEIADETGRDTKVIKHGDHETEVADSEWINRSRLRVDTRKWLMSKLAPKKYGDRTVLAGDPDAPLVLAEAIAKARKRV